MIRSRQELEELAEDALSVEFLIPLFKAMGFRDVVSFHGGTLEQGKDIVMWAVSALDARENYAVVVKAKKLTGNASLIGTALTQVKQALATAFPDVTTAELQRPTRVILASNKDITKECLAALGPVIQEEKLSGRLEFLGLDRLWELAEKHLRPWLVADSLRRAREVLTQGDPDFHVEATLADDGIRYEVSPKRNSAPTLVFDTNPNFPDSEEGRKQRDAYAQFVRAGTAVTFDQPFIPLVDPPPVFRYLVPSTGSGPYELSMPARTIDTPMLFRLSATAGGRAAEIPYIHFTTVRGGLVQKKFTNEAQPIPIRAELGLDPEAGRIPFSFSLEKQELPLFWALTFFEFYSVLAGGADILFEDLSTGTRSRLRRPVQSDVAGPSEALLDLLRRARAIEDRVQQPIVIPDVNELSDDSFSGVELAERVLAMGSLPANGLELTAAFRGGAAILTTLVEAQRDGGRALRISRDNYEVAVLGSPIDLGPHVVQIDRAIVLEADLPKLEAALASGSAEGLSLRFGCAPGTEARVKFSRWLQHSPVESFDRE